MVKDATPAGVVGRLVGFVDARVVEIGYTEGHLAVGGHEWTVGFSDDDVGVPATLGAVEHER